MTWSMETAVLKLFQPHHILSVSSFIVQFPTLLPSFQHYYSFTEGNRTSFQAPVPSNNLVLAGRMPTTKQMDHLFGLEHIN